MNTITEIAVMKARGDDGFCDVTGRITKNNDLCLETVARGAVSRELSGHDQYEHSITVNRVFTETVLLLLLKEKFSSPHEFRTWLRRHDIGFQEDKWPREEPSADER
jgi:hypothetical protein